MKCGLLGRKLGHSYSPQIHSQLGTYEYVLYEKEPEELEYFLRTECFSGLNVTMPYKQAVIPFLDELTPIAKELQAVNTIVRKNEKLVGHNTDHFGFQAMLQRSGYAPTGKKCLILGSGGASQVVQSVLKAYHANTIVISRTGRDHYTNLQQHSDAAMIVNTTPVGMYPNTGISPIDLQLFPHLEYVLDLIYNPARTQLLLDAEQQGIPSMNGLFMLVSQAKEAAEWFTGAPVPVKSVDAIHGMLCKQMENVILIGMPGCGKSTIGQKLALSLCREFVDCDAEVEKLAQKSISRIFAEDGEAYFRQLESQVLAEVCKQSGLVIATGGGCVTVEQNYPLLHQNGQIIWLQRDIHLLPTDGRPLSQNAPLMHLYQSRNSQYQRFADHIVDNNGSIELTIESLLEVLK